jgi:integrase/recombinase XerD
MAARKLPTTLTDDELAALLREVKVRSKTGLRNKAALKAMAYGGLRVSEVVALRTQDVRREDGRIVLEVRGGKGGRDRTVPLPDHAGETLEAWLAKRRDLGIGNGRVFCTVRSGRNVHPVATEAGFAAGEVTETKLEPGEPTQRAYWSALVSRTAKQAGMEKRVTPHVLRHTAATRMLKSAGDIRRVQEFLGHSNVSTTQIYTEVLASDLAEAVDAVPDVEAEPEAEEDEAGELADQVLAALPAEVRAALATKLKQEE